MTLIHGRTSKYSGSLPLFLLFFQSVRIKVTAPPISGNDSEFQLRTLRWFRLFALSRIARVIAQVQSFQCRTGIHLEGVVLLFRPV